jgi:hypothetical protein
MLIALPKGHFGVKLQKELHVADPSHQHSLWVVAEATSFNGISNGHLFRRDS